MVNFTTVFIAVQLLFLMHMTALSAHDMPGCGSLGSVSRPGPVPAASEDEGYRPLSREEIHDIQSTQGNVETNWRPRQRESECSGSTSLLDQDERGYRPLNYGKRAKGNIQSEQTGSYRPTHDHYPDSESSRYVQPRFIPGYGVMPYSFDGNTTVPY